jgi:hypothetical protein
MHLFGFFLIDETARWRLVRDRPTEIDFDLDDLVFVHRDDLGSARGCDDIVCRIFFPLSFAVSGSSEKM